MRRMAVAAMVAMALGLGSNGSRADRSEQPERREGTSADESTATCTVEIEEIPLEDVAGGGMGRMVGPARHEGTDRRPYIVRRLGTRAPSRGRVELSERTVYECDEEIEGERVISRAPEGADLG